MGKLNQGPFQGFIGKTGGLVGKRWKGKYVVSAYQPVVANPKSSKQEKQREVFKTALNLVTAYMDSAHRLFLSSGFMGTTVSASNIGFVARMVRQRMYAIDHREITAPLDNIQRASMTSGFADFGNTVLDDLQITQVGETDSFGVDFGTSAGVKYFGSDIPLLGLICVAVTNDESLGGIAYHEFNMGLTENSVNLDLPKQFGFFESADECGAWNFVYRGNISGAMTAIEGNAIISNVLGTGAHEAFCNIGFFVKGGTVISSRYLYKQLTVA